MHYKLKIKLLYTEVDLVKAGLLGGGGCFLERVGGFIGPTVLPCGNRKFYPPNKLISQLN